MTENGSKGKDFHKCCDDKGPTLTIIKTTSHRIFGGFTPLNWKYNNYTDISDRSKRTFIFSLNLNKKFEMKADWKDAIRLSSSYGPCFGEKNIYFEEDLKSGQSYAKNESTFLSKGSLELTNGIGTYEYFYTVEIEVFKVF